MLPVAILSGGLATRLRPATESIPKALIEIHGEPFIAHQLRLLKKMGVGKVVICVGYLGEMIQDFVRDGRQIGLSVAYSPDGPSLQGTAGAVKKAIPLLGEQFLVLYGDSYLECDYEAVSRAFLASGQSGLMTVVRNQNRWEPSNVEFKGQQIVAYDKTTNTAAMQYVDYGLSAFHASAFSIPGQQASDLTTTFQELIRHRQLAGLEINERYHEVGSWQGIRELQAYLSPQRSRMA